jgi:hypothetical protein
MDFTRKLPHFKVNNVLILLLFLLINLFLNRQLVSEIINDKGFRTLGGDSISYQFYTELFYKNLLNLKNPFAFNSDLVFPFGSSIALQDLGFIHALYFLFLRPFFSNYSSILISLLISIFLAQIFMYMLLKYLKIPQLLSFIFALSFAFYNFAIWRMQGHFSYVHFFLFPLTTYLLLRLWREKKLISNLFLSILIGLSATLLLYSTIYHFIMFFILTILFIVFYLMTNYRDIKKIFTILRDRLIYITISFFSFLLFSSPLLIEAFNTLKAGEIKETSGWAGALIFVSQNFSLFLPSPYNPIYGDFFYKIFINQVPKEGIIYPGIIVIIGLCIYLFSKNKRPFLPLALTALVLYLFSMGPFIYIPKIWKIYFPDPLIFWTFLIENYPLKGPFFYLHEIPFLSMLRSPIRFAGPLAFSLVILATLVISQHLEKFKKKVLISVFLLLLFFIDQFYVMQINPYQLNLPLQAYQHIKQDPSTTTVLEIPFTIRDGLLAEGDVEAIQFELGNLFHEKPIIGGYLGRVSEYKFEYYRQDPLLRYVTINIDGRTDNDLTRPDLISLNNSIRTLNIKYVIIKNEITKYSTFVNDFQELGFRVKLQEDNGFTLLEK